jgi:hypothetical protein
MNNPKLVLEFTQKSVFTKTTFKMVEKYDMTTVKAMIKSPFLNTVIPDGWFFPFENEKKQLEALLKCIKNNTFVCDYDFTGVKVGRVYTTKTLGFISLRKELRAVFANGQYADIDIENAHPTIINQLCGDVLSLTILPDYINNRATYLNLLINNYGLSRDDAKQTIISILYGAGIDKLKSKLNTDDLPAWILQLKDEIKQVCKYIIQVNPKLKQLVGLDKNGNARSDCGILSYYLQEHERIILETVYNFLITKGIFTGNRDNGALCFDGIMILKDKFYDDLLAQLSDEIKNKLGFDLKFTCKDLEIQPEIQQYLQQDNNEDLSEVGQWYKETKLQFEGENLRFKCDDIYYEKDGDYYKPYSCKSFENKHIDYANFEYDNKTINFFSKYKLDPTKIKFDKLVFDLDIEHTPEKHFNVFKGYKIQKNTDDIPLEEINQLIEPIIGNDGLLYHLSGKKKEVLDYLLKYLSGILQSKNQSQRPGVMIVFRDIAGILSTQYGGNGKDTFINWFSKSIIGQKYYFECSRTDDLFEKFNDYLENKVIINVPELEGIIKCARNWNTLKNYVSSPTIKIESKGVKVGDCNNYMNIFASTNEDFTFEPDRRLLVIDVSKEKKGNAEYWNNLYNNVLNNERVARAFYLYLTKYIQPYQSTAEFQDNKPITVAQVEQKENKKALLQSFFEDVHSKKLFNNETKLNSTDFLKVYKKWCDKHNFTCEITTNGLGQKLTRLIDELQNKNIPLFIDKYRTSSIRGYKLDYNKLSEWYVSLNPVDDCLIDDTDE